MDTKIESTPQRPCPLAPNGVKYSDLALGLSEIVFELVYRKADPNLVRLAYQSATSTLSLIDVLVARQIGLIDQMNISPPNDKVEQCRLDAINVRANLNALAQALDDLIIGTFGHA